MRERDHATISTDSISLSVNYCNGFICIRKHFFEIIYIDVIV